MVSKHKLMNVFDETTFNPANKGIDPEVLSDIGYVDYQALEAIIETGGLAVAKALEEPVSVDQVSVPRSSARRKGGIDFNALRAKLEVAREQRLASQGLTTKQTSYKSFKFFTNAEQRARQSRERR